MSATNDWHIDKRVSVSHLIATCVLAGGLYQWASTMDTRISVLERTVEHRAELAAATERAQRDRMDRYEQRVSESLDRIEKAVDRISEKLDQKADKDE